MPIFIYNINIFDLPLLRKLFQVTPVITRQMAFPNSYKILVFVESEKWEHCNQIGAYCFVDLEEE